MYVTPINSHGTPVDWFALGITLHEFVTGMRLLSLLSLLSNYSISIYY